MNDVFIERMVKKKMEPLDMLIIVGVLAAILVAGVIGFVVGFLIIAFPMLTLLLPSVWRRASQRGKVSMV